MRLARVAPLPPPPLTPVPPPIAHRVRRAPLRPGCSNPGRLFVVFSQLPRTLQSVAPGSPPDDPVQGLGPCSTPPRMLQSGASFCRILSFASEAPVRGTGFTPGRSSPELVACFIPLRMLQSRVSLYRILSVASVATVRGTWFTPGRSSPGASAVLHSAPVAPIRGVSLSYSLRCLGCSSPWHRVHPRTIQSGGMGRAPLRPGCSYPGRLLVVSSPLPRMLQSVAPGSPPDDPVRGLVPCFIPPWLLHSGASFYRLLSIASDAPVRGTGFSPGQSSPGARAKLHSAPDAPIRGVMFLTLFAVFAGVCVRGALVLFFFRAPFVIAPPPPPPAPLSLAPCPAPRFVVCCAHFPGSRHAVAIVAWHLSSCRGCGRQRASLACLVAPRWCAAPHPVRSLSVLRIAFPSPWCLPQPRGLSPPALLGCCAGHVEAGREPGSCACRWPLPRQGR